MYKYEPKFSFVVADWHRWFAWKPVYTVDRGMRWLIFVWKRPCQVRDHIYKDGGNIWWQYVVKK